MMKRCVFAGLAALLVGFLFNCTENSNPASATPEKSADLSNSPF